MIPVKSSTAFRVYQIKHRRRNKAQVATPNVRYVASNPQVVGLSGAVALQKIVMTFDDQTKEIGGAIARLHDSRELILCQSAQSLRWRELRVCMSA